MTVRRNVTESIALSKQEVLFRIEHILKSGHRSYSYQKITADTSKDMFQMRIMPNLWPLILSTEMKVEIEAQGNALCTLNVSTTSQKFIFGDRGDYYSGYIRDFLKSLKNGDN